MELAMDVGRRSVATARDGLLLDGTQTSLLFHRIMSRKELSYDDDARSV